MRLASIVTAALSFSIGTGAFAYPDGAPWDAAGPASSNNCAACHFDGEVATASDAIGIAGLPARIAAGGAYDLEVTVAAPEGKVFGFLLTSVCDGQPAGTFEPEGDFIDASKGAARSTMPVALGPDGAVRWALRWTASAELTEPVTFYLAVNAANGDESAFGDTIHFRAITIELE